MKFSRTLFYNELFSSLMKGNEIYVRLWDHVLYDKQLPTVDCSLHTYPIAHAAPGNVDLCSVSIILPLT